MQALATTHTATVEGALDEIRSRFKGSPLSGGVTSVKHLPAHEA
jgi:hypothetical protein